MASIVKNLKTVTANGEITINLNLVITISNDGEVKIGVEAPLKKKEDINYEIPDFCDLPIIEFGKKV